MKFHLKIKIILIIFSKKKGYLLERALLIAWLLILSNSCEIEVMICPTVFWLPLASNWIIGLVFNPSNDLLELSNKSQIVIKSDRTVIDDKLYSAIKSDISRTWIIRLRLFPAGNRTANVDIGEKAIICNFEGSFSQPNLNKN